MTKYGHSRSYPLSRYGVPIGKLLGSGKVLITQIESALARRKAVVHWDNRRSCVYVEAKYSSDLDDVENVIQRRVRDLKSPYRYSGRSYVSTPALTKASKTTKKYVDHTGTTVKVVVGAWNLPAPKNVTPKTQGVKLVSKKWLSKSKLSKAVALATPAVPAAESTTAESDMTLSVSSQPSEKAESVTTATSERKLSKAQRKRLRAKKARAYRRDNAPVKTTPQRVTPQIVKQQKLEKQEKIAKKAESVAKVTQKVSRKVVVQKVKWQPITTLFPSKPKPAVTEPVWATQKSKSKRRRRAKAERPTTVVVSADNEMPSLADLTECATVRKARIDVSKLNFNFQSSAENVAKRKAVIATMTKGENAPAAKIHKDLVGMFRGSAHLHFDRIKNLCFATHGVPVAIYVKSGSSHEKACIYAKATRGTKTAAAAHAARKMASTLLKARQDLLEGADQLQKNLVRDGAKVVQPKLLKPKSTTKSWSFGKIKTKLPVWHRRLLKDLEELETQEFPDLAVHLPNEKDLKTWHVNLRGPEGPMEGCILHLEVRFSEAYPAEAPKVRLLTRIPGHPNTFGEYICLDMLKKSSGGKYNGWTPAYSASSLLMQLQSFLCAENVPQELSWDRPVGWSGFAHEKNRASAKAFHYINASFECPCGHKGSGAKGTVCMPAFDVAEECFERETVVKCTSLEHVADCYRGDVFTWRTILQFLPADTLFACTRAFVELDRVATRWNMCEAKHMRCYYTKKDIKEAVLGIGILRESTTDNYPECITTDGSYISVEAWTQHDVQQGVYGKGYLGENSYNHFLPLAMNATHFKKSRKYIDEALAIIANNPRLTSALKLDTICDFMIKVLVQLLKTTCGETPGTMTRMDMCEAAVQTFCSLHHLMLSYCRAESEIRKLAVQRLQTALRPGGMVKSVVQNLGYLMMYQTVVDDSEVSWDQLKNVMVEESFLRSHKWNPECHDPTLEPMDRINKTFHARTTSRRIMLFQFAFVQQLCRKNGRTWKQNLANYDRHCGSPGRGVAQELYEELQQIIAKDTWKQYFTYLGLEVPTSPEVMAKQLLASMDKSVLLRYHNSTFAGTTSTRQATAVEESAASTSQSASARQMLSEEEAFQEIDKLEKLVRTANDAVARRRRQLGSSTAGQELTLFEAMARANEDIPDENLTAARCQLRACRLRLANAEARLAPVLKARRDREAAARQQQVQARRDRRSRRALDRSGSRDVMPRQYIIKGMCSEVDGVYTRNGTYKGSPRYESANGRFVLHVWGSSWYISREITPRTEPDYFRSCSSGVAHRAPHNLDFTALKGSGERVGCIRQATARNTFA